MIGNVNTFSTKMFRIMKKLSYVIILLSLFPVTSTVNASELNFLYETDEWTLKYEFSKSKVEPGNTITLTIEIESKTKNYDFKLWIKPSDPLSVDRILGSGSNIHYPELDASETREDTFTISVPSSVTVGETYIIHIKAQSHTNARTLNQRLPGDRVETSFNSEDYSAYVQTVEIVLLPEIEIKSDFGFILKDMTNTFTIIVINNGRGTANDVVLNIHLPNEFIFLQGEESAQRVSIQANKQITYEWKVKTPKTGSYNVDVTVLFSNHDTIEESYDVSVLPWWPFHIFLLGIALFFAYPFISNPRKRY